MKHFEKRKKYSGDMADYSFAQNLAWIHAAVSENGRTNDRQRMAEACATTVALLTKSSKAKNAIKFLNFGRSPIYTITFFIPS